MKKSPFSLVYVCCELRNFIDDEDAVDRWLLLLEVICLLHFLFSIAFISRNIGRSVDCYNLAMWKIFLRVHWCECLLGCLANINLLSRLHLKALTDASWWHSLYKFERPRVRFYRVTRIHLFIFYWQIYFWYEIGYKRDEGCFILRNAFLLTPKTNNKKKIEEKCSDDIII